MTYKIRNGAVYRETSKLTSELVHHSAEALIKELLDSRKSAKSAEIVLRGLIEHSTNMASHEKERDLNRIRHLQADNEELAEHLESRDQELHELRAEIKRLQESNSDLFIEQMKVTIDSNVDHAQQKQKEESMVKYFEDIILKLMAKNNNLTETNGELLDKHHKLEQEFSELVGRYNLTKQELQHVYNKHWIRVTK